MTFTGSGSDDSSISEYEWHSDKNDMIGNLPIFSISDLSVGIHNISFRVRDDEGIWSDKVNKTIRINRKPIAVIEEISPILAAEGKTVEITGKGEDNDGWISAYHWRSDIDGNLSSKVSFFISNLSNGTHGIYLRVQDNEGAWSDETSRALRAHRKIK